MRVSRFADRTDTVYRFLIAFLVYLIGGLPTLAYALPQGGTISSGAGTIDTSGSSLTVNQTTNKIIINWESFSIGNNESVIFLQPDSTSSALNNVLGTSRTVVEGNLTANGQIVLSNPNGIFISPNANIDVAGLIASTLKISEQDFLDGLYKFSQDPSKPLASILNEGKIRASDFAALIAPSVDNKGVVIANLGTVGLVSGKAATVDFVGDNLIKFTVNEPVEGQVLDKDGNLISDRISNSGSIQADGGQVILSAKNASSIIKNVINMDGVIEANSVTEKNGRIFLGGGDQGTVRVAGTLNASGEESGLGGGEITIEGAEVIVAEGSIQAKGTDAKGGNITITGTDWVDAGSTMDVSGETGGNVNITTGGLSLAAPVLARGTTGDGGNININTLFKSWEVVSTLLDVSGASGGTIKHFAGQEITTSGEYLAIGTVGAGGSIDVTANTLKFMSNTIDASGTMGGGSIRLGGEYQGGKNLAVDEILNAKFLFMTDAANITARTTGTDGAGGRVIAWADQKAMVLGQFDVRPGTQTGAGGFVEVSSADILAFDGSVRAGVDDRTGTLLLDPKYIEIRSSSSSGFDSSPYGTGNEVFGTFAKHWGNSKTITPATIVGILNTGTAVILEASKDLTVKHSITVSAGGGGGHLQMQAGRRITINANKSITTDNGDLTLKANDCTGGSSRCTSAIRGGNTGYIIMNDGSSINIGAGDFTAAVGTFNGTGTSGNITLTTVTNVSHADDAQAGADATITLASGAHGTDDFYNGMTVYISSGTGSGQLRTISDYVGSSNVATVSSNWTTNPDSTSDYEVRGIGDFTVTNNGTSANSDVNLGATTVGGNLSVTATNGTITDSGVLTVAGTSSFTTSADDANITLDQANLFTGAVSFTTAGTTGDAALTTGTTALILGASTVNGDLAVTAGGAVTQSGALTILGDTTITAQSGGTYYDVTLNSASNDFDSDDSDDNGKDMTVTGKDVNIRNSDAFKLGAQTISGNLTVQAGGDIDDGGLLDVDGTTDITATGYVKLNNGDASGPSDYTGAVSIDAGGQIVIKDGNSILLGNITTTGTFTLTASLATGTTGTVTQTDTGTITIGNPTTITNTGGDVRLDRGTNNFGSDGTGSVKIAGADVSVTDANLIDLGASTVSGTYTVTAVLGNIVDSGTLAITDLATFNTSADDATITLTQTGSTFANGVSLNTAGSSGNATIDTGTNALDLSTSSVGGSLAATAGNTITDSGVLTVTGTSSFTTDVDGADIFFDQNHAFTGAVTITTVDSDGSDSDATISAGSSAELKLAASSIEGNLTVTSGNEIGISQEGALTVEGTSSFTTSADGADIDLDNTSNNLDGTVHFVTNDNSSGDGVYAGNVILAHSDAIEIGTVNSVLSSIKGNLKVDTTAGGAVINDNGSIKVYGTTDLTATGGNSFINWNGAATSADRHDLVGLITATGHHVKISTKSDIYATITATRGQIIMNTDGGNITQDGPWVAVSDTTAYAKKDNSTYYDVTLNNASNSFGGGHSSQAPSGVRVDSDDELKLRGKDVLVASNHSFNVGVSTVTGDLTLTSGAAENIDGDYGIFDVAAEEDSATIEVGENFSATTTGNNGEIDMGDLNVDGTIALTTVGSGAATIVNDTVINFAPSSVGGNLTATATLGDIDFATSSVGGNLIATATDGDITDSGALTITGTATFQTDADGSNIVLNSALNAFSSWVKMKADDGGASSTGNETFGNIEFVDSGPVIIQTSVATDADGELLIDGSTDGAVGGTLSITATDGDITQGAIALAVTGASTFVIGTTEKNIVLDNASNAFSNSVTMKAGTAGGLTFGNITFVDSAAVKFHSSAGTNGDLYINAATDGAVGGALNVTAKAGDITQGHALTVTGTTTLETSADGAAINLNNASNKFEGALTITTKDSDGSDSDATITAGDGAKLIFAASSIEGNLIVTSSHATGIIQLDSTAGVLTVEGTSSFTTSADGADIDLSSSSNVLTGAVSLSTEGSGGYAKLSNGSTNLTTGTSTVDGYLTLTTSGQIIFGDTTVGGNLSAITSGSSITDDGTLVVTGTTELETPGGNFPVDLQSTNNDFGDTVKAKGHHVKLKDINGIKLGRINATHGQLVITAGGAVTQTEDYLSSSNQTKITATGFDITLNQTNNSIGGHLKLIGKDVSVTASGSVTMGISTISGKFDLTTSGAVTQADALEVAITTTIEAKSGDTYYAITLDSQDGSSEYDNDFQGAVLLTGSNVEVDDLNDLELGTSTVTGTYIARSQTGDITDAASAELTITSTSTFVTIANGKTITLDSTTNAFTGALLFTTNDSGSNTGGDVTISAGSIKALDFGNSTIDGDLIVANNNTTGGATESTAAITDSGVLTVRGTASFQTTGLGANIYLDQSHVITGKVTLNTTKDADGVGGHATLDNGDTALELGTSAASLVTSVDGNLTVRSGNSLGITDASGETVTVGRNLSATTDRNSGVIDMETLAVGGTVTLTTNGTGNATIDNGTLDLDIAASSVGGDLTLRTGNADDTSGITDTGTVTVGGNLSVTNDVSNGGIVMGTLAVTGTIALTTSGDGNATIDNGTLNLEIATSSVGGDLTLTTAQADGITDGGTVTVGGNLSVVNGTSNGDINMGSLAVTGTIALTTSGSSGNATVVNSNGLTFASTTVGNDLTAEASAGSIAQATGTILNITGDTTLTAANAQSINLNNGNIFTSQTVAFNASGGGTLANVTISDTGGDATTGRFDLAALTLASGGNLVVTAGGAVSDSGTLVIPGTTTISAAGQDVALNSTNNNFTGAVSIEGKDVAVTDISATVLGSSTVTGTYQVTSKGTVSQLSGTALKISLATTISAVNGSSVKQDVTLTSASNNFLGTVGITGADVKITDMDTLDLGASTIGGTYDVIATIGNITQSGSLTVSGASAFETKAENGTIFCFDSSCTSAGDTNNAFSGTVELTTTGSEAHAYIDNGTTALVIAEDSSVGGDLRLVSGHVSGITDEDDGPLTVGGDLYATTDASNGVITLNGLAVSGQIKLNTIVLSNTGRAQDGDDTEITLTSVAGVSTADDFYNNMKVYISSGTGAGQVRTISDYVGSTKVATISSAWTTNPDATSDYEVRSSFGDATVVNTTGLYFKSASVGGDFAATATTGSIKQDGALNIAGTADFLSSTVSATSGNIILNSAANDFVGNVRFIGGAVVIKDANDINFGIGDSTAAWNKDGYALKVYAGDQITDDVNLFVTGPTVADIGDGNAWFGTNFGNEPAGSGDDATSRSRIDLDNGGHTVDGTWTLRGGIGYTVSSASAVVLTPMDLPGDLRVTTTGGAVTDTGVLSVEGLTVITATDGSGNDFDVTLDGDGTTYNNFQDEVRIIGADVVIKDTNAIKLGKSTVSGAYDVTAGGTVTQNTDAANPLVITGATAITGTDITLNNTENNFGTAVGVTTTGSDVILVDEGAIVLGESTVTGFYRVTAGGAVTQFSGTKLTITGATTINAGANAVTLENTSNDFSKTVDGTLGGAVGITGTAVSIIDTNDLVLGTTTTTGNYTVVAGGGITDSGTLTIGDNAAVDAATFTAGGGESIILDQVSSELPVHNFLAALTFAAPSGETLNDLTVKSTSSVGLAALTLAGNLSIQAGEVTQSGAWVVPGTTTITPSSAIGSDVTLSNTSNNFGGAVSITGVNVTLVDAGAIDLGTSVVSGFYKVTATAGGGITDSGVLNITGASTFTAAGGQSILLTQSSTFTGAVTFASGGTLVGVSITDSDNFELQVLTLSGNLVVASGGTIRQNGVLTIGGTSSFTTSTNNKIIDLAMTNAFTGAFTLSSTGSNAHVTIDNGTTAIVIASASVGGNLTLTSGAAAGITDIGTVTVGGKLIATTDANSGVINMVNLAVDGSIALTTDGTGDATIVNDAGLNFGESTVGGDLTATATTLNISDSATIKVTGATIITLGTNPVLSVAGAKTATDIYGLTITLDDANNLFTGGITLRYDNVLPVVDNSDIDLARQVVFAELLWGLYENTKNIYGAYEDINEHDILRMYELFLKSLPKPKKEFKEVKKHLSNEVIIKKIKTSTTREDEGNKEL